MISSVNFELDREVSRCAVIGVHGEEQWGEHTWVLDENYY